jgi:hypothetical protein
MYKCLFLAAALLVSTAAVAQQVDINGKDFLSGAGDARLADIARQAAAQNKKLVVTAPDYWQSKVAAKLHAGAANVDIQPIEGFFENVLVRMEDAKVVASPKPDTSAVDAAKAAAVKADAEKAAAARSEAARQDAERAEAEREQAARLEAERAATARIAAEKAAAEKAAAEKAAAEKAVADKAAAEKAATEKAAADRIAVIKHRMEKNLNDGREADGTLAVAQLQKDDQLFVDSEIRGVVRRSGARTQLYWLQGELNLERVELVPVGDNHYRIAEPIKEVANPTLRSRGLSGHIVAAVPAANSAERKSLQQQFAEGHEINGTIRPADLRTGDVVYAGNGACVVVRRSGTILDRFWLEGDLKLAQAGLQKQGDNVYRVLSDTIR